MIVYESDVKGFRCDVLTNRIEERILELFKKVFGRGTSPREVTSWKNSLVYMDRVLAHKAVPENAGVAIELLIPGTATAVDIADRGRLKCARHRLRPLSKDRNWPVMENTRLIDDVSARQSGSEPTE